MSIDTIFTANDEFVEGLEKAIERAKIDEEREL